MSFTQYIPSILHPHQIKPVRRRDRPALGTIPRGECMAKIFGAPFPLADQHERAHDRAHLMMKERARLCNDADFVAAARHIKPVKRFHRRLSLAFGRAEGREIMIANQPLRRRVHGRGIEWARRTPRAIAIEREIGPAIFDAIKIMPLDRGEARVKRWRHFFSSDNGDRMRAQVRVKRVAYCIRIALNIQIEMRHLTQRMHARVGAAGALHRELLARKCQNRRDNVPLHGRAIILDLPADERRVVIFDRDLVAWHSTPQLSTALPGTVVPRKNSSTFIGCLPARCNCKMRTAPSRHAIVRWRSSTVPGAPSPSALVVSKSLTRPAPPISHHAPGNGDNPRMWSCTCRHGLFQSMRVSALSILAA